MKNCVLNFVNVMIVLGCLLLAGGCDDDSPTAAGGGKGPAGAAPDFVLTDMNRISSTYAQPLSPRDHMNSVSAWYFGHST